MKHLILPALLLLLISSTWMDNHLSTNDPAVNAIIGDASFVAEFGVVPDAATNEQLRLLTHLRYVEQLLRSRNVDHLSIELKQQRSNVLDLLHQYWTAGIFPRNYDHPDQRRSCFIDNYGNICAVGFLVEKTAGRSIAEQINARFKYDRIKDMDLDLLHDWIANSGLTLEECAMIQPQYGFYPPEDDQEISSSYAISTALFTGANISMMSLNSIQVLTNSDDKAVPIVGMITGAGQLTYGLIKYPVEQQSFWGNTFNKTERNVSLLNIGMGTATLVMSTFNLILKPKETKTSWNVFSFPATEAQSGIGLAMVRRF